MKKTIEIDDIKEDEWWEIKEELESLFNDWDLKYKEI
jgi:hypothetical protein